MENESWYERFQHESGQRLDDWLRRKKWINLPCLTWQQHDKITRLEREMKNRQIQQTKNKQRKLSTSQKTGIPFDLVDMDVVRYATMLGLIRNRNETPPVVNVNPPPPSPPDNTSSIDPHVPFFYRRANTCVTPLEKHRLLSQRWNEVARKGHILIESECTKRARFFFPSHPRVSSPSELVRLLMPHRDEAHVSRALLGPLPWKIFSDLFPGFVSHDASLWEQSLVFDRYRFLWDPPVADTTGLHLKACLSPVLAYVEIHTILDTFFLNPSFPSDQMPWGFSGQDFFRLHHVTLSSEGVPQRFWVLDPHLYWTTRYIVKIVQPYLFQLSLRLERNGRLPSWAHHLSTNLRRMEHPYEGDFNRHLRSLVKNKATIFPTIHDWFNTTPRLFNHRLA